MTTATTPRQPAKRAKGRAHPKWKAHFQEGTVWNDTAIFQDSWTINADQLDAIVERMARAMCRSDGLIWRFQANGQTSGNGTNMQTSYRESAIAALKSIGIAAPRKERGSR